MIASTPLPSPAAACSPPRRLLRLVLPLISPALLLLSHPSRAAAQCAPNDADGQASQPPIVWTEPADSTWSGATQTVTVSVTVDWCGPYAGLDANTDSICLDGTSVTGSFTWQCLGTQQGGTQHCLQYAKSTGTVTLSSGMHQLQASIRRVD